MINTRLLYLPGDKLSYSERKEIIGFVNPILHQELSHKISEETTETPSENIWFWDKIAEISDTTSKNGVLIKRRPMDMIDHLYKNTDILKTDCDFANSNIIKSSTNEDITDREEDSNKITINLSNTTKTKRKAKINKKDGKFQSGPNQIISEENQVIVPNLVPTKNVFWEDKNYERKNVYYKTLLRDFRKFICKDFDKFIKMAEAEKSKDFLKSIKFGSSGKMEDQFHNGVDQTKIPKLTPYWVVNNSIRAKVFIPLLYAYTEHMMSKLSLQGEQRCQFWIGSGGPINFKSEEELIMWGCNGNKEKLMMILGCLIHYKDFSQAKWSKIKVSHIIKFLESNESKTKIWKRKWNKDSEPEQIMKPEMINNIFKVFSQKVNISHIMNCFIRVWCDLKIF